MSLVLAAKKKKWRIITLLGVVPFFFIACSQEIKDPVTFAYNRDSIPQMTTDSVDMQMSDSGLIRYKVVAQTWEIYDKTNDPYSRFPKGLYLEQFDTLFQVVATVRSDTAWNFSNRSLWQLKGNVLIKNNAGVTFAGGELFWDEKLGKIYSKKAVVINQPEKGILRAAGGFESNQEMTEYKAFDTGNKIAGKRTEIYTNDNPRTEE